MPAWFKPGDVCFLVFFCRLQVLTVVQFLRLVFLGLKCKPASTFFLNKNKQQFLAKIKYNKRNQYKNRKLSTLLKKVFNFNNFDLHSKKNNHKLSNGKKNVFQLKGEKMFKNELLKHSGHVCYELLQFCQELLCIL